ncbi:MAG: hypothetical protein JWP00_4092 [Chloroflexi bacterium]|nr:hypothetical protein [Chloroflexota bacterium]
MQITSLKRVLPVVMLIGGLILIFGIVRTTTASSPSYYTPSANEQLMRSIQPIQKVQAIENQEANYNASLKADYEGQKNIGILISAVGGILLLVGGVVFFSNPSGRRP